jgi:hypothetical protein
MAKLFYTLEEAAEKLGKSTSEIMEMAKAGQLQELRDKEQVLFRRSAIDQLAGDSAAGTEFNLDEVDLGSEGSSIQLGGSDAALEDDLALGNETAELSLGDLGEITLADSSPGLNAAAATTRSSDDSLSLDDGPGLGLDDLRLDDDAPAADPIAASGADDSMALDDLVLDGDDGLRLADDEPAPARAPAADVNAASATGISAGSAAGSAAGLADSAAASRASGRSRAGASPDDSMAMETMDPSVESVGAGSGLLDISSDESFFGAQMIDESETLGGEEMAQMQEGAADLFGAGAADAAGADEAAPVTAGAVGFGMPQSQLAEALDPKFSGFAAGAMVAAALALVGAGWATTEFMVGDYAEVARMIAENGLMVIGAVAGAALLFGGIGFGIGKATA